MQPRVGSSHLQPKQGKESEWMPTLLERKKKRSPQTTNGKKRPLKRPLLQAIPRDYLDRQNPLPLYCVPEGQEVLLLPPAGKNSCPGLFALQNPLPLYCDPEGQEVPLLPPARNTWFA